LIFFYIIVFVYQGNPRVKGIVDFIEANEREMILQNVSPYFSVRVTRKDFVILEGSECILSITNSADLTVLSVYRFDNERTNKVYQQVSSQLNLNWGDNVFRYKL